LKGNFFTRGKLLEINLLDSAINNPAFCSVERARENDETSQ